MASYELSPFQSHPSIHLVGAIETLSPHALNIGFWIQDPNQSIIWPALATGQPREHFLWETTCYEVFIGVKDQDMYREIHLSPSQAWQAYAFEEYRYPEHMPPVTAHDVELLQLKRTHYGLNAQIDLFQWMTEHKLKWSDLYLGLSAVICTDKQTHLYAMQHFGQQADFHNKRTWLHEC